MFTEIQDSALRAVASLLAFFYSLPVVGGSYGLAIIMLTMAVMIILMPLTIRAARSTIAMTALQPELKRLQKEYADDKQQLQQEMMGLYSKHGVNPVGGCLPIVAQLPVFLILFNVLRGLTRRTEEVPFFSLTQRAQVLAGSPLNETAGTSLDPNYISHSSELYQKLITEETMRFGPFDLAAQANEVIGDGVLVAIPYVLLILFVVGSSYFQQWQITTRRGVVPDNPTPQQQTQQQLMKILPLMSGIWSFFFPVGLVLYWSTSNIFRIAQQFYITRAFYGEDGDGTKAAELKNQDPDDSDKELAKKDAGSGSESREKAKQKPKRSKPSSSSNSGGGEVDTVNGAGKNGGAPSRDQAWAEMRQRRSKMQARNKKTSSEGSTRRVTPKGTKPTASKKKKR